jgi:hypothetical protein
MEKSKVIGDWCGSLQSSAFATSRGSASCSFLVQIPEKVWNLQLIPLQLSTGHDMLLTSRHRKPPQGKRSQPAEPVGLVCTPRHRSTAATRLMAKGGNRAVVGFHDRPDQGGKHISCPWSLANSAAWRTTCRIGPASLPPTAVAEAAFRQGTPRPILPSLAATLRPDTTIRRWPGDGSLRH